MTVARKGATVTKVVIYTATFFVCYIYKIFSKLRVLQHWLKLIIRYYEPKKLPHKEKGVFCGHSVLCEIGSVI